MTVTRRKRSPRVTMDKYGHIHVGKVCVGLHRIGYRIEVVRGLFTASELHAVADFLDQLAETPVRSQIGGRSDRTCLANWSQVARNLLARDRDRDRDRVSTSLVTSSLNSQVSQRARNR